MDQISIRYGENVTLPIDAGDTTAVRADIFVGTPGEVYIFTTNADLTDGAGFFELSQTDTEIPLGEYSYQINVTDSNGAVSKYPSPEDVCDGCEGDFPKFVVYEALDSTEVS